MFFLGSDMVSRRSRWIASSTLLDRSIFPTEVGVILWPIEMKHGLFRAKERVQKLKDYAATPEVFRTARIQDLYRRLRVRFDLIIQYGSIQSLLVGDSTTLQSSRWCSSIILLRIQSQWSNARCFLLVILFLVIFSNTCLLISRSGLCKLWTVPDCKPVRTLRGHTVNACCISWHPQATLTQDPSMINLASSSFDGSVKLWNLESEESIAEIEGRRALIDQVNSWRISLGHAPFRVAKVKFHPSGRFLATAW